MRSRCGRRAFRASPIRCVGERIMATGVPEFREVAWRAWSFLICASICLRSALLEDNFSCSNNLFAAISLASSCFSCCFSCSRLVFMCCNLFMRA
ncbi:hypothetical protein [Bathymodiolus japonicus methanotrophic gill symbiont]|uniref:hypothetical protein n=1 Tax=Bathymodiolus japonicus methanotrophic gill symbiont TaxID=113269 RepID=UPI001C8EF053|nr:hypothetical protein [Bathymodiolus japonicus methanotrophic gill symbiont]